MNNIAKWNGSSWSALGSGLSYGVLALSAFDDGSGPALYAAGDSFPATGGAAASRIAKWNGSHWSALGTGILGGFVVALTVFDDGAGPALYAAGNFTSAGGLPASRIAKWNGVSWSALGSGIGSGFPMVYALTAFDDGSGSALYAAGLFTTAGGVPASNIARWNGSSWSALGSGMNSTVYALSVFDDGGGAALYAAGLFTTAGGVSANRIARWNGSNWSALGSGIATPTVFALSVFDDGSGPALYVGGDFATAGGIPASNIARWNGTSWSALGSGVSSLFASSVDALSVFDDGGGQALYVGGLFTTAGGLAANNIARWNGSNWSALGSGMNYPLTSLAAFDDGHGPALYAGGGFDSAYDSGDSFLAKWGCDTAAPVLSCPPFVYARDFGSPGEVVSFSVTASDLVDPSPVVVCVPSSGSFFPRGNTLVACTATDSSGNQSTCQFQVIVQVRPVRPR